MCLFSITLWHESIGHGGEAIRGNYYGHANFRNKTDKIVTIENEARQARNANPLVDPSQTTETRSTKNYETQGSVYK